MSVVDQLRLEILDSAAELPSFHKSWAVWRCEIERLLPASSTSQDVFDFGSYLSEVFLCNRNTGRGQGAVSASGTAWECLVEWYLNLVFWGTPVVAARRKKAFIPKTILNALSVTIGNNTTNSESDIIVFNVPQAGSLRNLDIKDTDELVSSFSKDVFLSVVQCKTNWNDNSQIPMLWDLIYNMQGGNRIPGVSVGIRGMTPQSFKEFTYAFATIPTQTKEIKPTSVVVQRVKNLTGGNYWGRESLPNVASSINEYFGRNFALFFDGGVQAHIANQLDNDEKYLRFFKNLDFHSLRARI